jgi:carboxyl-terminal processing protease
MLKNKFKLGGLLLLIVMTVVIYSSFKATDRFELVKNLDIFSDLFIEVNNLYVDQVQSGDLIQSGIDGMLASLDPYTVYYPESEIEDYKLMTTGQYGGIGARIRKVEGKQVIRELFNNSPAVKAGLKVGDVLVEVDGNEIKEQSSYDLSKLLKGNPGTDVKVKLKRAGIEEMFDVVFKREEIKISSVPYYGVVENKVGYIKVTSFTRNVSEEVKDAFIEMKTKNNITSLILDLRGNPGGLLLESINMVNLFTKKGEKVVETRGKVERWNKQYKNLNRSIDENMPVVVLVNDGSASASEIVSGSLQDMDRAVIIGNNTYGKGLVQTTVKLKYNTSLKVTTAKYYIPSGRCIQEINYAKKDKNGVAEKKPDSLRIKFKTRNGREVEDGHGIQPDIQMDNLVYSYISDGLMKQNHVFNFVTTYLLGVDSILQAKDYVVSNELFNQFVVHVEKSDNIYQSNTEKQIGVIAGEAEKENLKELITKELEEIKNKINKNKVSELLKQKEEIKSLLQAEIITRFYYREGKIESMLAQDKMILKAQQILENTKDYRHYLSGNMNNSGEN